MSNELDLRSEPMQLLRELRSLLFCMPVNDRIKGLIQRINDIEDRAIDREELHHD